ncbi:glycosyltransferase [Salipaludibacillus aurantiacus]|uniref:Glycosyltransferase, catalytic subunit of cellulose synthase and poly-beta-1,6-N-acetylglucosamine synthase n=1 Tax=Salipaludibacillus aurantiacus TaxID=1601833 RepID=A0A1H9PHT7_9BACI|nr:glycosyltransferase family 2 protein [Salipaludibacillus aurantiacus]SER47133.1 Glycosyltransferase, catalytic subunit of cellulose synthase and poly-beta-1,6-N-acetylglucosamine synthase [Salipaludibacillus aurantiacus]
MLLYLYLAALAAMGVWVLTNAICLPRLKDDRASSAGLSPRVSVLIPVRNEERNIEGLVQSLKSLSYKNSEFIILDDSSTDATRRLLEKTIGNDQRFTIIEGKPLPDGWVGKVHACHQLAFRSSAGYLLFIDADVRLHPQTIERSLNAVKSDTGLVTGFPRYPVKSFLGHLLVPMQHFVVLLHLPVLLANLTRWPAATAAHGSFMLFRRDAYTSMGGHEKVKNSLVEDVHIAREIKKNGYKVRLVNNTNSVLCYMYETSREVWEGFSKNLFPGLGRNPFIVIGLIFFYFVFFILPLPIAAAGLIQNNLILLFPLLLTMLIKLTVDLFTGQKWWLFSLTPFALLSMILLMIYSSYLGLSQRGFEWKGRTYQ